MRRRASLAVFLAAGVALAFALALFVSPHASSKPDGLERAAGDTGFLEDAREHALASGPLADYSVRDVDDPALSTGFAGVIGVALVLVIGGGLFVALRWMGQRPPRRASSAG